MNRMGWFLFSSKQELTRLSEAELLRCFHRGYPDCREEDRPYQLSSQHVCSDKEWQAMSHWLTGDPTFLKKLEIHRQELQDKTEGTKADGTARNKSRRVAPPAGTGSSSSAILGIGEWGPWPAVTFQWQENVVASAAAFQFFLW